MNIAFRNSLPIRFSSKSPRILKWFCTKHPSQFSLHQYDHLIAFLPCPKNNAHQPEDVDRAVVSAFKSFSPLSALPQAQQLHAFIFKSGLDSNIFIHNSLISFYAKSGAIHHAKSIFDGSSVLDHVSCNIMLSGYLKFGFMDDARQLFDRIPGKTSVSYTSMIVGLQQKHFWCDTVELFKGMMCVGLVPNEVTVSSALASYSHLGGSMIGQMLHAFIVKTGFGMFNFVITNLVHVYCTRLCLNSARILFDEMGHRNRVSWNVMLNGYSKAGLLDLAKNLFENMPERDVVSWGTIIDCYLQAGKLSEALILYRSMLRSGIDPNDVMIVDVISACGQVMALYEGQQFHCISVKLGLDSYSFIQSTIIHFYASSGKIESARIQFELGSKHHLSSWNALVSGLIRNGMIDSARDLFNKMPERDVFSWSSMISGYAQMEQPHMALELLHEMEFSAIKPNEVTMVSVLSAIATLGTLEDGRKAHEFIYNNAIPLNDNLIAAIIDMYSKCGSISTALQFFSQVRDRVSTISPWNAILCGLAMHGNAETSLAVFSDLLQRKINPNSITFIGVLSACCHAGLVEAGEQHFKSMKSLYNVDPNIKHYGCMVDMLGRAGRLKDAEEVIKNMPMKADVVIWGTLLAAARTHGNAEVGERAAENLANTEPSHGPGRILLSSLYADLGRWDDATYVRQVAHSQRLTKSTGYSGVV